MTGIPAGLTRWCEDSLGSGATELLWTTGHLSTVAALRLSDGREVVVKVRADSPRLAGCHLVHTELWAGGFPCAQPLTPPLPIGELVASAETHLPGGRPGRPGDPWLAARTAGELRRLISMAPPVRDTPSLEPPLPWAGWLDPRADPWPPPDEGPPLNGHEATQPLVPLARSLNEMLRATDLPLVVGHSDWYQGNLRWEDGRLVAADDWDSIAALPEAAFVGCSAVSYLPSPRGKDSGYPAGAGIEESAGFFDLYGAARGRALDPDELRVAWGAGLWQRVFDSAKFLAAGSPARAEEHLRDADERLRLASLAS